MLNQLYLKSIRPTADMLSFYLSDESTETSKAFINKNTAENYSKNKHVKIEQVNIDNLYKNNDLILNDSVSFYDHLWGMKYKGTYKYLTRTFGEIIELIRANESRDYGEILNISVNDDKYGKKIEIKHEDTTRSFHIFPISIVDVDTAPFTNNNYYFEDDREESIINRNFITDINAWRESHGYDKLTEDNLAFSYYDKFDRFHSGHSNDPLSTIIQNKILRVLTDDDEPNALTVYQRFNENTAIIKTIDSIFYLGWYKWRPRLDYFVDIDNIPVTINDVIDIIEKVVDPDFFKHPVETYANAMKPEY